MNFLNVETPLCYVVRLCCCKRLAFHKRPCLLESHIHGTLHLPMAKVTEKTTSLSQPVHTPVQDVKHTSGLINSRNKLCYLLFPSLTFTWTESCVSVIIWTAVSWHKLRRLQIKTLWNHVAITVYSRLYAPFAPYHSWS